MDAADVRRWVVWLLGRYSESCAYQQHRSLEQFFRWLATEGDLPSPMARLRPPKVAGKPVPFFSSVELSKLGRYCRGNSFEDRRDAAVLAVFLATGIRVSELAAIRYYAGDPDRGVRLYPHRFRHHFSHAWLERGGAEGDLMELNGWVSPQMLTRYGASASGARARRSYDRVMGGLP